MCWRTSLRIATGLLTGCLAGIVSAAPAIHMPEQTDVVWSGQPVALAATLDTASLTVSEVSARVDHLLTVSLQSGNPRPLGEAQILLSGLPAAQWTTHLLLDQAVLQQRMHDFAAARASLDQLLARQPDHAQALITAFNVAFIQGDQQAARQYCHRYQQQRDGLVSTTCTAMLKAADGDAGQARDMLEQALQHSSFERTRQGYLWALSNLAELQQPSDHTSAGRLWALGFYLNPDDLYLRKGYANWLLSQGQYRQVVSLTQQYQQVDALLVLRAIALKNLKAPESAALNARISERFDEARQRGPLLHSREYARFLLDVEGRSDDALYWALQTWRKQHSLPDFLLLQRAARVSGQLAALDPITLWRDYARAD